MMDFIRSITWTDVPFIIAWCIAMAVCFVRMRRIIHDHNHPTLLARYLRDFNK